jgi:hypothetical protein
VRADLVAERQIIEASGCHWRDGELAGAEGVAKAW